MVTPGEETRTTTVVCHSPTLRLLSQGKDTTNGKPDVHPATSKVDQDDMMFTSSDRFQRSETLCALSMSDFIG